MASASVPSARPTINQYTRPVIREDTGTPGSRLGDVDVVVVGAGFAGLYALHRLRDEVGLRARVYEATDSVGGTWYINSYPGARCDTESHAYCYSFSQELLAEWRWSSRYPARDELLAYLNHVADRFNLRPDIELGVAVEAADWDDDQGLWTVRTSDGTSCRARFLVTAVGSLSSAPYVPNLQGVHDFAGLTLHTSDWPVGGIDLKGKSVGVIGTGSSGCQVIKALAPQVEHLTVFQRTPHYVLPANEPDDVEQFFENVRSRYPEILAGMRVSNGGYPWDNNGVAGSSVSSTEFHRVLEELWSYGGFRFLYGGFNDVLVDTEVNERIAEFVRGKIFQTVHDSNTADVLSPHQPIGASRPVVVRDFYETFNRENVTLVDLRKEPLESIVAAGVRTSDRTLNVDVLIFATGFDAFTGIYAKLDIHGRNDRTLAEAWANGPVSNMGVAVHGFPNMFMVMGPGSSSGNYPVSMELHVDWIANTIRSMIESGTRSIEVSAETQAAWMVRIERALNKTVMGGADSWWNGSNIPGKPKSVLNYMGRLASYRILFEDLERDNYPGFDKRPVPIPVGGAAAGPGALGTVEGRAR